MSKAFTWFTWSQKEHGMCRAYCTIIWYFWLQLDSAIKLAKYVDRSCIYIARGFIAQSRYRKSSSSVGNSSPLTTFHIRTMMKNLNNTNHRPKSSIAWVSANFNQLESKREFERTYEISRRGAHPYPIRKCDGSATSQINCISRCIM